MNTVLVTGITSMHGWPIYQLFQNKGYRVFGICSPKGKRYFESDPNVFGACVTDQSLLAQIFQEVRPSHVIHASGMCDLDGGEKNPKLAYNLNVQGTEHVLALSNGAYVCYISADLVFSGENPPVQGYAETDEPDPISEVGRTYLAAEQLVLKNPNYSVIRIGLPMGPSVQKKKGAVDIIHLRLRKNLPMTLYSDEYRSAIYLDDLAQGVYQLCRKEVSGIYHWGGPKPVSLYEMGEQIIRDYKLKTTSLKKDVRHNDPLKLPRIGNVHLNSQKAKALIGIHPRPWNNCHG